LRTVDENLIKELEKRHFVRLMFRSDPALHSEQFKIINIANNEELS
jgi:hypothetical protein